MYRDYRFFMAMIVLAIFAVFFVFFNTYHSINCVYNKCTTYKQTGMFGFKKLDYSFNRKDIEKYEIGTNRHRTHSRRHSYSYHTDYYPILVMKDGQEHRMPFEFCRDKYRAEEFALDIMSERRLKKSEHPFGW